MYDLDHYYLNSATRESVGVTPLLSTLNLICGWPIISKSGSFDEKGYDWKLSFVDMIAELAENPVFSVNVGPDANHTKVNRFNVSLV